MPSEKVIYDDLGLALPSPPLPCTRDKNLPRKHALTLRGQRAPEDEASSPHALLGAIFRSLVGLKACLLCLLSVSFCSLLLSDRLRSSASLFSFRVRGVRVLTPSPLSGTWPSREEEAATTITSAVARRRANWSLVSKLVSSLLPCRGAFDGRKPFGRSF